MKSLFLSFALLALFAMAFSQAASTKVNYDLSGFSGYGWGTSIEFVTSTMEEDGYEMLTATREALWYRARIDERRLQIVYLFNGGLLSGGMWVFEDVDQKSFWKISDYLRKAYSSKTTLKIRGDKWIETEMRPAGTNALIIHHLDVDAGRHVVNYYHRSGAD